MSEPITGELRDAMERYCNFKDENRVQLSEREFENHCDAIDAIHANLERENDRLKCELDRVTGEMEEHHAWAPESHYMMLPKDADGVPIRIGDVMEWVDIDGEVEVVCTVDAVGVGCFFAWDAANCRYAQKCANAYRHYHAPTVEDILRGVVELCRNTWKEGSAFEFYDVDDVMKSGNIAEYAAKLRLVGDAE